MMLEKMNLTRDINKCYARLSGFVCCRYLDSCLRRCSQLFCSNNFALPNTNIDCETNWNTNQERNTDRDCDKYKMFDSCLRRCSQLFWSSDFASAVASCIFLPFHFFIFLDLSSTLHTSQIMTLRERCIEKKVKNNKQVLVLCMYV